MDDSNHDSASEIANRIGFYILNFGVLEFKTFLWIDFLDSNYGYNNQESKKKLFKNRVEDIIISLNKINKNQGEQITAIELWKSAQNLAKFRNSIAHNPIVLVEDRYNVLDAKISFEKKSNIFIDCDMIEFETKKVIDLIPLIDLSFYDIFLKTS